MPPEVLLSVWTIVPTAGRRRSTDAMPDSGEGILTSVSEHLRSFLLPRNTEWLVSFLLGKTEGRPEGTCLPTRPLLHACRRCDARKQAPSPHGRLTDSAD